MTQVTRQGTHHKQFVESSYSARYSGWDNDKAWSSQEWKADEMMDDRTVTTVVCRQRGPMPQQFIIGDDEAELELSLGSRSFLERVNDQVRKRQKRSSMNVTEDSEKTFCDMGIFMSSTLESSVFMGKNYSGNWHSIKIQKISQRNKCSTNLRNWCPNKMRSQDKKQLVGKILHGSICL